MTLETKINFYNELNKKIYILENPKKLLNRYFFSDSKYIQIKLRRELYRGILKFFLKLIFKKLDISSIYIKLPKSNKFKQKIINLYSLLFISAGINKYSNSILIIGDYQNALNMALLQLSFFDENIEFWIINQGTGSIEKKLILNILEPLKKFSFLILMNLYMRKIYY